MKSKKTNKKAKKKMIQQTTSPIAQTNPQTSPNSGLEVPNVTVQKQQTEVINPVIPHNSVGIKPYRIFFAVLIGVILLFTVFNVYNFYHVKPKQIMEESVFDQQTPITEEQEEYNTQVELVKSELNNIQSDLTTLDYMTKE